MKPVNNKSRQHAFEKYNGKCAYCGVELVKATASQEGNFTVDHIKPIGKGGHNHRHNLNPACRSCNSSKGMKTLEEWRYFLGFKTHPYSAVINSAQAASLSALGCGIVFNLPKFYFEGLDGDDTQL